MWILSRATRWMTFWPHTSVWCWPAWTNRRVSRSETDREKTKFWCIPKTDICNKDGRHFVPMEPVINFVLFIKDSPCPFIHDNPVQNPFLLYPSCLLKHGRHIPVSWLDWLWNFNYDIMKPGNVNGCRNFITWLALLIVTNIDIYIYINIFRRFICF